MRTIEVRTIDEDINALYVDDEFTGLQYTKRDINLMIDDLLATQSSLPASARRSRDELLTELVQRTLANCVSNQPLRNGSLTSDELREAVRLVAKSCKKGWF